MSIRILSIIIPVYNEAATIRHVLERVCAVQLIDGIEKEIIVIDDGSTDDSDKIIRNFMVY